MQGDNIGKLLNLFFIVESGEVSIEPSWQSWLAFCIFLVGSLLFTICGVGFQQRLANLSAEFFFTLSAAGFGMTLVAILAILLGYSRRRRCRVSNRYNGVCTIDTRPQIPEESVWIEIEKDLLESSHNVESNQQRMNPIYGDCDQPLYETETEPFEADDCEEQYSDDFDSSSETRTCYYNSSSEDEDCCQTTAEENDLIEVDKQNIGSNQNCGWMVEQNSLENGRVAEQKMVSSPTTSVRNLSASISQQEPKPDQYQVYLHNKMTSPQMSDVQNHRQSSSRKLRNEILLDENWGPEEKLSDFNINIVHLGNIHSNSVKYKISSNCEQSDVRREHLIDFLNTCINLKLETYEHPANLNHESGETLVHPNDFHKIQAMQFNRDNNRTISETMSTEWSDATQHAGRKRWRWSERNEDMMNRIKKRPLLDANGNPISQWAFVKELTELFQNGLPPVAKHPEKKCI